METSHTPGPWQIGGSLISSVSGYALARVLRQPAVYGGRRHEFNDTDSLAVDTGAEADANARLIASAPDLLAALEKILGYAAPGAAILAVYASPEHAERIKKTAADDIDAARAAIARARGE